MNALASVPQLAIQTSLDRYSNHGYRGPSRNVRIPRVTPTGGGGTIARGPDDSRCAVTGKESLRIIRVLDPSQTYNPEHKSAVGGGGHRIDASRNFWDGSGLKIDSASTDVAWAGGPFSNKILTSARNGELIMWDLNKSGSNKCERRVKLHLRSINKLSVSHSTNQYCISGSADGDLRVWDLRDLTKSVMRVHNPTSVRSVVFSPLSWMPFQVVVGLDNGTLIRWDLKMGQRGQLDRVLVAHTSSVTTLDWRETPSGSTAENSNTALGWLISGGLDRRVKVWDLSTHGNNGPHLPSKPAYTLHPSFPVRRVLWRPQYECEIAIVSNSEFSSGSNLDLIQSSGSASATGLLTRVNSGLGLDAMFRSASGDGHQRGVDKNSSMKNVTDIKSAIANVAGDSVEIWDVRKGWIAKWSLPDSSVDGGVTDIAFGDSHAIWAQHASGAFSQVDLRDVTKPLDAIPRVAATWEASGSLTFVSGKSKKWDIPFDDFPPEHIFPSGTHKKPLKGLGNNPFVSRSQTIGTFVSQYATGEFDALKKLALEYLLEGMPRTEICALNAKSAALVNQDRVAHTWLLMGTSLTNYEIDTQSAVTAPLPPAPAQTRSRPPQHISNMSSVRPSYTFPPSDTAPVVSQKSSPGRTSAHSLEHAAKGLQRSPSASLSRKMTPVSSASSSPRHRITIGLPAVTQRRASLFSRRKSVDSGIASRQPLHRRSSVSTSNHQSASPSERNGPNLRNVGEGVLDDSDSSDSEGEREQQEGIRGDSSDEESGLRPLISPVLLPTRIIAAPSPLSRVAVQQLWTEDEDGGEMDNEDEASSPSPRSTDSESERSGSPQPKSKSSRSVRRNSGLGKTRSRSSTVASLAAGVHRSLGHRDSHSSIRTVIAGDTSLHDAENVNVLQGEETLRDISGGHLRQKSQITSESVMNPEIANGAEEVLQPLGEAELTSRKPEIVQLGDDGVREICWVALRDMLEEYAIEGDIQMCAMMSLIAPEELQIPRQRVVRFIDAYLDILNRLKLFTCAAYLRKYSGLEDVRNASLVETTIYTSCGKCRKPLMKQAGIRSQEIANYSGQYSYCSTCRASCVACAICRLPVRALLFQCSVCNHGGHQSCYQQYYTRHPMVMFSKVSLAAPPDTRGHFSGGNGEAEEEVEETPQIIKERNFNHDKDTTVQRNLRGHPCAAGCGHFCWASN